MAPATTPPLPGSMTVPPLFGWETIVAVLVLLLVVALAFFLTSATGRAPSGQSEFQAWLAARSDRYAATAHEGELVADAADEPSRRDGGRSVPTA